MNLDDLVCNDLVIALGKNPAGDVTLEEKVLIPEADVLRCRYKGKKFNLNFDLVYGVFINPIDKMTQQEKKDIEECLISIMNPPA